MEPENKKTNEKTAEQPIAHMFTEKAARASRLHDGEKVRHSVTINRSPEDVFAFFRDFKNLPAFMKDLVQVEVLTAARSRWTMQLQHGPKRTVEWEAEIITERFGEMISWQSVGDSDVDQAGSVWFSKALGQNGTIVRLSMSYTIPFGKLSQYATKIYAEDPDTLILTNLRRLKALLETGEIPTTEGQSSGKEDVLVPIVTH